MSEEVKVNEENQFTFENPEYRKTYWHTCSHVLAQAVKRLWPEVKLAIGPSIDNGFYYDMLAPFSFTPENLAEIEAEMRKICKEKLKLERFELPRAEAIKFMEEKEEPFKVELINDLPEDAVISFYKQGEFTDLCAGPHLDSTGRIKGNAIKLTACNAAYWRGDSNREVLQRIYGVAFPKKEELDAYLKEREEAVKRDHNKLGRELEYFTTVDCIGQGLPVLLPKGARVVQVLQRWVEDTEQKRGYLLTKTPLMAKRDLYKISGHWDHYLDGMFILGDPYDETKECFALRPMTCPFQYQVYLNRQRSYRDLPMRLGETSTLFRNEDSGEMHGLIRVRQFTISEGHLVLRPDQLEEEFKGCLDLAKYCLGTVGLLDKCTFRFSQWDPANPNNKYEGTKEQWDHAQSVMERILKDLDVDYTVGIDEAAFYGPKLDIQYKNVYGKEDTLVTIQIDMLLAERFGMYYTDENGEKNFVIHLLGNQDADGTVRPTNVDGGADADVFVFDTDHGAYSMEASLSYGVMGGAFTRNINIYGQPYAPAKSLTIDASNLRTFYTGDTFNPGELVVTATRANGAEESIWGGRLTFTGYDSDTTGTKTVTASFLGATATFEVQVEDLVTEQYTGSYELVQGETPTATDAVLLVDYSHKVCTLTAADGSASITGTLVDAQDNALTMTLNGSDALTVPITEGEDGSKQLTIPAHDEIVSGWGSSTTYSINEAVVTLAAE